MSSSSAAAPPASARNPGTSEACAAARAGVISPAVTPDAPESGVPETPVAKRILLGQPLSSDAMDEHLLPKKMALPIFASDALSSVAYAPQELLMITLNQWCRS